MGGSKVTGQLAMGFQAPAQEPKCSSVKARELWFISEATLTLQCGGVPVLGLGFRVELRLQGSTGPTLEVLGERGEICPPRQVGLAAQGGETPPLGSISF